MSDPTPVGDDEEILRHVPGGTLFQAPGPRITSKNFELRASLSETGLSVSRAGMTSAADLMARLGNPAAGSRIAVASVAEIRAVGLDVVPAPIDEDAGHAEIRAAAASLTTQSVRKRLAMIFRFIDPV